MQAISEKKQAVKYFLNKNILISSTFLDQIDESFDTLKFEEEVFNKIKSSQFLVIFKDLNRLLDNTEILDLNWIELEKSLVLLEKGKDKKTYEKFMEFASRPDDSVKVLFSYKEKPRKREVQNFVSYFHARYDSLEKILKNRPELNNISSINRIINKKDKENISFIGLVKDKQFTKNGNLILTLEDPTGQLNVLVTKNKSELFEPARDIVLDEVIGVVGVNDQNIVYANNILWPDVAFNSALKKSPEEAYAVFLSDLHVGSNKFLPEQFQKFIKWINEDMGNEDQKAIAEKVKYLFIVGDLVDGVSIYPGQESELEIQDIYSQYDECARLLNQIPSRIKIIICPGNHDAMRIAEPQPLLSKDFAKKIWELPNVIMVSNPAFVNIHSSKEFPGFDILMYHGYSFDYYVANVDSIRSQGGYDRADLIMKFLLQRRHLAPSHTSTLYLPDVNQDPLVIKKVPDFFVTGHIHKSSVSNYRNITMICGSCWQSKTAFQEKVGHHPEPARVPIANLKTREVKILKFS